MKAVVVVVLVVLSLTLIGQAALAQEPAIPLPDHTGSYTVGRVDYHLIDEDRDESFTPDNPDDKRELMVTVYYPAENHSSKSAPYVTGILQSLLSEQLEIAPETWDFIETGVFEDVSVADGSFPVLIFSPGLGSLPLYYTALLAEIASHGYVVAAMWHPYSTDIIVFPDDRVILADTNIPVTDVEAMTIWRNNLLNVWVGDAIFVLDTLTQLNQDDVLLMEHLNLEQVGIFGHSFGGATAVQATYQDDRFLVVANMDGTMSGKVVENGITQPFMMMQTQNELEEPDSAETVTIEKLKGTSTAGYVVSLRDAEHLTFQTDFLTFATVFPELITPEMIGTIDPQRAYSILTDYLVAFFSQYIKGETASLLDGTSPDYPEVVFEN